MDKTEMLYELCEVLTDELETVRDKIDKSGMSAGELEVIDKLSHALKSLKTIIAMGDDYSYNNGRRSYNRGRSNQRNQRSNQSYQGNNQSYQRRYSREYSYAEDMDGLLDDMREMLPELPEEKRRKAEKLMDELAR